MNSLLLTCMRCHHVWDVKLGTVPHMPLANLVWGLQQIRCPLCNAPNDWVYVKRELSGGTT